MVRTRARATFVVANRQRIVGTNDAMSRALA